MDKRTSVAHITPHLGGGVGASVENFVYQSEKLGVSNQVFCLDWCENPKKGLGVLPGLTQGAFWHARELLDIAISECDCLIIHYWNHPLLSVFLSDFDSPKWKLLIWCHNSGIAEPNIVPKYLMEISEKLVFTSKASFHAKNFEVLSHQHRVLPSVVPTVRDLRNFFIIGANRVKKRKHQNLLYVGSVVNSKMHPDSALIFSELSKRGLHIEIVGGPDHKELADQVELMGGRVEVFGHVENVYDFYQRADLFVYPLRAEHYGTGEQVILEALASGLPVVAFRNPAEAAILDQFSSLKLAESTKNFLDLVSRLVESPQELSQLSREVHLLTSTLYESNHMTTDLLKIIDDVIKSSDKKGDRIRQNEVKDNLLAIYARASFFDESVYQSILKHPHHGIELIISAIESVVDDFSKVELWRAKTKSTPGHYWTYFPDSQQLDQLVKQLNNRLI